MVDQTKLIILRGPSGAGKSSTSKMLIEKHERKIAYVEQDYFRSILFPKDETHQKRAALIAAVTIRALNEGYDVILEGLLTMKAYKKCFEEIFESHPENNFMFYFDISFEETVKRTKHKGDVAWTEDDMREWYPTCTPAGYDFEHVVSETMLPEQIVKYIAAKCCL